MTSRTQELQQGDNGEVLGVAGRVNLFCNCTVSGSVLPCLVRVLGDAASGENGVKGHFTQCDSC